MVRSPGHGVSREPVSVQPRSACIRLIGVHLCFPLLCCGRHGRRSSARCLVFVRASRWCLGVDLVRAEEKKVETQMHADQKG
jgi:hypothetical protein